jgi:DtxR family transcriptional regulator, Mn-dependent transcriptional regulator
MNMLSFSDRLRARLRALRGDAWDEACAAGAPLPESDECAATDCDAVALSQLRPGETGVVSCLRAPASAEARRLVALGVLPGVRLRVVQSYPAHVFQLGHAELAVDSRLAGHIRVRRVGGASGGV